MDMNTNTDLIDALIQAFIQFVGTFVTFLFDFFRQALAAFLF